MKLSSRAQRGIWVEASSWIRVKEMVLAVLAVLAVSAAVPRAALAAVARFDTYDVVLRAGRAYDGASGTPNPFTDVTLTAEVASPSGRRVQVEGFFDGDGRGGAVGDVFKVRIFADEPGTWSWRTSSSLPALDGKAGAFACAGSLAGRFAAGPLVRDPRRPRSFKLRAGRPIFLLGKFLDVAAPPRIRFSHTLLSEELSEADREAMLARHLGMSLNKMNVYLANRGDYGAVSTTPWVGTAAANDKRRFDLARWHLYERWVGRLRDAGLLAQLWFFADDSRFGDLPEADRARLVRYGMARLSGYVNIFFTLALEWQEGWTADEVERLAAVADRANPWGRLLSVHGVTGDFKFPAAAWADYMEVQAGNDAGHEAVYELGLRNRALAAKPLIQEEHGLGKEDTANRQKAWAVFASGAAGLGTGAFLRPLASFVRALPFERLQPAGDLVESGTAYVLAEPGEAYVAYLPEGGKVSLDLTGARDLGVRWFDPRRGLFSGAGTVAGDGVRTFTAPGSGDWALLLRRPGALLSVW
jgi:uncharacterized protein DUF5060/collagenase-like protein with putative collagen-binding domain